MSYKQKSWQFAPSLLMEDGREEPMELRPGASDIAIEVQNLSKCYQIYSRPLDRLKQSIFPRLQRFVGKPSQSYFREFWALKDVSFSVNKGETVGIVGRNGSGKSTLLQLICGTLNPTSGSVRTNGRIAALLELGSGFNPEFTGRENVYMNATVLGLSEEEIAARFDDIVAFADIGEFIEQPVKTYSSGMVVRLAFAVQSQINPDILVVDEALSVGDAKFQAKCFERLKQLKNAGTSILLVTHSSEQVVTHCSRAFLFDYGVAIECGDPRQVINRYMDVLFGKGPQVKDSQAPATPNGGVESGIATYRGVRNTRYPLSMGADIFATRAGYNPHEYRWGDRDAAILDYYLAADGEAYPSGISVGQTITLAISVHFLAELVRPILGITIKTKEGVTVYGVNSETLTVDEFKLLGQKDSVLQVEAIFCCRLAPGDYFVSLGIATRKGQDIIPHDRRYDSIHLQVRPNPTFFGLADLNLKLRTVS
jgi:lipopolysaccharide transport system ATP-binding protein